MPKSLKHEVCLSQVLKDEDKRRLYDQVSRPSSLHVGPDAFEQAASGGGPDGPGGPFGSGFGNPFEDIFGMNDVFNCGVLVCPQIFMQNGPFRLQTTCSHCGGSGKLVKVREDPVFRRDKANIHVDTVLSVTQVYRAAMLGGTVQVPTLTGDAVLKVCRIQL
ncbi:hypothetical protein GW17_00017603 [Ensete ventricosum]|nr:hypothetical protein GW17_00017603 [Ensete ventricosum]